MEESVNQCWDNILKQLESLPEEEIKHLIKQGTIKELIITLKSRSEALENSHKVFLVLTKMASVYDEMILLAIESFVNPDPLQSASIQQENKEIFLQGAKTIIEYKAELEKLTGDIEDYIQHNLI